MATPSARALRKAQEIRHVRRAMRFYEHKKNEIAETKELRMKERQYYERLRAQKNEVERLAKTALVNARVDWELGHLRPNRAMGDGKSQYGTMPDTLLGPPDAPKHWIGAKNIQKRMPRKNIPDSVVREFAPFQQNDRVVVVKGKDKGKIGVVISVSSERNMVIVKDMNKVWVSEKAFKFNIGNEGRREWEIPYSIDQVRLVVPQTINGVRRDVIVESIEMERHSSGMNLFTGNEEKDIPEAHQVDPETGDPIWHRYIAGTRTRIEWPWEETAQKKQDARENEGIDDVSLAKEKSKSLNSAEEDNKASLSISERIARAVGLGANRKAAKNKTEATEKTTANDDEEGVTLTKPRDQAPVHNGDTTRNFIEDETYKSWMPSLRYEPFPSSVLEEIAGPEWKRNRLDRGAEDFEERLAEFRAQKAEIKAEKKRAVQAHIDTMKTPLEVKWELAQAAKAKEQDPNAPPKIPDYLLSAIGQHIASKQVRK